MTPWRGSRAIPFLELSGFSGIDKVQIEATKAQGSEGGCCDKDETLRDGLWRVDMVGEMR